MLISAPPLIKWTINFHDLNVILPQILDTLLRFLTLKKEFTFWDYMFNFVPAVFPCCFNKFCFFVKLL